MNSDTAKLEEEIRSTLADDLLEAGPEFTIDSDLFEFGLDSLATMRLIVWVEERFGVVLPAVELSRENLKDVRSLASIIRSHLDQSSQD